MMLRVQRERMSGGYFPTEREYAIGYGLSPARLDLLGEDVPVLHPGPMNRGLEISSVGRRRRRGRWCSTRCRPGSRCGWPCSTGCSPAPTRKK